MLVSVTVTSCFAGRQVTHMASTGSGNVADESAAREEAEVAVELSEAGGRADSRRVAGRLRAVADRTTAAVTSAAAGARRGADTAARRRAATARRGASNGRPGRRAGRRR